MKKNRVLETLKKIEISFAKLEAKKAEINRLKKGKNYSNSNIYDLNGERIKTYLVLIPKSQMKLYVLDLLYDRLFFDSLDDLLNYIKSSNLEMFNSIYILDYIGDMGGMSDVLRISSNKGSKYITAFDKYKTAVYEFEKSFFERKHCWALEFNMTEKTYDELEKRGIRLKTHNHKFDYEPIVEKKKIYRYNPNDK